MLKIIVSSLGIYYEVHLGSCSPFNLNHWDFIVIIGINFLNPCSFYYYYCCYSEWCDSLNGPLGPFLGVDTLTLIKTWFFFVICSCSYLWIIYHLLKYSIHCLWNEKLCSNKMNKFKHPGDCWIWIVEFQLKHLFFIV